MFRSLQVSGPRDHPREAYPPKQFSIIHEHPRTKTTQADIGTRMLNKPPLKTCNH